MYLVIDSTNWRMMAAAKKKSHVDLVAQVLDIPSAVIVNCGDGGSWTVISRKDMATLYKNTSGLDAPEYGDCIEQLREYGNQWSPYPVSEADLEKQLADEAEDEEEDPVAEQLRINAMQRAAHQATIQAVEDANAALTPEQRAELPPTKPAAEQKPKIKRENSEPRKPGSTKRVWDIADQVYAEHEKAGGEVSIKVVRARVMELTAGEGINAGTAATQFGKWKGERGYK